MTMVIAEAAREQWLRNWLDGVLRLFTNEQSPARSDPAADYVEAVGFGYAPVPLSGAGWLIGPGEASFAEQHFTFTGALGPVYGYYVTDVESGALKWVERFAAGPVNVPETGGQITITPRFALEEIR